MIIMGWLNLKQATSFKQLDSESMQVCSQIVGERLEPPPVSLHFGVKSPLVCRELFKDLFIMKLP
jgi:hypothetical protein